MGVGVDLEDGRALERFAAAALHRFMHRWFTAAERSWCVAHPSLARALVIGIACKEAVYKSIAAPELTPDQVQIEMAEEGVVTTAFVRGAYAVSRTRLVWTVAGQGILALAVDSSLPRGVLDQLLQLGRAEALGKSRASGAIPPLYGQPG